MGQDKIRRVDMRVPDSIPFQDKGTGIGDSVYTLDLYSIGYTINTLKIVCDSGTCDAAVQINGVDVTGISAVAVSSTIATGTASAANIVAPGDTVTLMTSSTSSLDNLQASLLITV